MNFIEELVVNSETAKKLSVFIDSQIDDFYLKYKENSSFSATEIGSFSDYLEEKRDVLEALDYSTTQEKAFISFLFDICEQYGLIATVCIESVLQKSNLYLGKRREAAKLFLLNIKNNSDYLDRFDEICNNLQCAIDNEEDDIKKALVTFANYYSNVIRNSSKIYCDELKNKILFAQKRGLYAFISNEFIMNLLSVEFVNLKIADETIQGKIRRYLSPNPIIIRKLNKPAVLMEENSNYSRVLEKLSGASFKNIREIALKNCSNMSAMLKGRGVDPLQDEEELYIYLKSFGNMHEAKMLSAFKAFPFEKAKSRNVEIIDWGCGQGLASIALFDYLRINKINFNIDRVILVEPSAIAIKRAALHIKTARQNIGISTICKYFDELEKEDVVTNPESLKIHLFSNILDLGEEMYSQNRLIQIIEESQIHDNIFVCVSPYITDAKADRIDSFKRYFQRKYSTYFSYDEQTISGRTDSGYWSCNYHYKGNPVHYGHRYCNLKDKWTKIIRVFQI